ncbi:MAG: hypothetical protein GX128_07480 [Bacteroidales bacterium]|jgi:uncharacterized membrane protein|nr:hypothetical protein [Bacteroidales bacterium]
MEKNITVRIFKIISVILIIIAVISMVAVLIKGGHEMKDNQSVQNSILNPFFLTAYVALGLCLLFALLFPIINTVTQPKKAIRALIGVIGLVIVGIIAYVISKNELSAIKLMEYNISESGSRQIGAALIVTYFIAIASVIAVFYAEISNLFKN